MQPRWLAFCLMSVALMAVPASLAAQEADPIMGTWVLNVAKSKYNPPSQAPKSTTVVFETEGKGFKVNSKGTNAQGQPISAEYSAAFDGKDYPISGNPAYDAVSLKRLGKWGYQGTRKKAGKPVQTYTVTISKDGKTATNHTTGTDAAGNKIDHLIIFDKQ